MTDSRDRAVDTVGRLAVACRWCCFWTAVAVPPALCGWLFVVGVRTRADLLAVVVGLLVAVVALRGGRGYATGAE